MTAAWFTYTRFELLRTFRNRRFFIFSLVFPLVLYFLIAGPNRNDNDFANSGVSAPLYYMVGLASFGTMTAMLSSGARIATEREAGWNRQLRLTPLRPRAYLRAKVLTAYLMACVTIALLYISGASLGVSIPANEWVQMTLLILIGLVPFAAGGILIGHLVTTDSVGPDHGRGHVAARARQRHVVPARPQRRPLPHRPVPALVLDRPGERGIARGARLAGARLDSDRRLDRRAGRTGASGLPARYPAHLSAYG